MRTDLTTICGACRLRLRRSRRACPRCGTTELTDGTSWSEQRGDPTKQPPMTRKRRVFQARKDRRRQAAIFGSLLICMVIGTVLYVHVFVGGGVVGLFALIMLVFGGAALRGNPSLAAILRIFAAAFRRSPVLLRDGEFAGAVGALELATRS